MIVPRLDKRSTFQTKLAINCQTYNGDTPLHYAVGNETLHEIVVELMLRGADPSICNFEYQSASESDEAEDVEFRDAMGVSPLDLASCDHKVVHSLLTLSMNVAKISVKMRNFRKSCHGPCDVI